MCIAINIAFCHLIIILFLFLFLSLFVSNIQICKMLPKTLVMVVVSHFLLNSLLPTDFCLFKICVHIINMKHITIYILNPCISFQHEKCIEIMKVFILQNGSMFSNILTVTTLNIFIKKILEPI